MNDLGTGVGEAAGIGSGTLALTAGGQTPPYTNISQEWAFPGPTAVTLTEGDVFLSGGTALKGFGKAVGIPAATWAIC